jgi:hypothetical protein
VEHVVDEEHKLANFKARSITLGGKYIRLDLQVNGHFWPILLQKSFWGGERKFLEPLIRFARGDVRDHIGRSKIDNGPPCWR